jgi:activator of HSP90 ATPase
MNNNYEIEKMTEDEIRDMIFTLNTELENRKIKRNKDFIKKLEELFDEFSDELRYVCIDDFNIEDLITEFKYALNIVNK